MVAERITLGPVKLFIDGKEVSCASHETFESYNPSTGTPLAVVEYASNEDVGRAVDAARDAFENRWSSRLPGERGRILLQVSQHIRSKKEELARLEALDAGVPIGQARADVEVAARYFEFYAGIADKILGDTIPVSPNVVDFTIREPWGVCGIIVPFNFPLQIFSRSVAPALAAGNAVVVKSAEQSPLIPLQLAKVACEAGLPSGVLNVVHGFGDVGAAVVEHPGVDHVTFTGSQATGAKVMEACARHLKPITLEMGGKSPQIVLDDSYLDEAAQVIVGAIFRTSGQACSAGSRVLVHQSIHDKVVAAIEECARKLKVGKALDNPDLGPLITKDQLDYVLSSVDAGRQEGAQLRMGGFRLSDGDLAGGYFVPPTLFSGVSPQMGIAQQEIFGPVLVVTAFADAEEALRIANRTDYGLVAGVWTRDIKVALSLATRLKAGQVFINTYGAGAGVELPFGGYKKSGFGREKGVEAIREYTQVKNICIKVA